METLAVREHTLKGKYCILLNFCEVKSERRSLTLVKKFRIIKKTFLRRDYRVQFAKAGPRSSLSHHTIFQQKS